MRIAKHIILASNNLGKFREFEALFNSYHDISLAPVEGFIRNAYKIALVENHATYLENAIAKARIVNQGCHYPALADDSGLEVEALGLKPGVRSHRYAKLNQADASPQAQHQANRLLVLDELRGKPSRKARFVTVLALLVEGILIHAEGILEGEIANEPKGEQGFGYDSIFIPTGMNKTLAELSTSEKNAISHRARAVQSLMAQVQERGIVFAKP